MLMRNKLIAAVRNYDELISAADSDVKIVFDLNPNILTLDDTVNILHEAGKKCFIHLDLAEGIGKDRSGLSYLKMLGADGIISTKTGLLRQAKELSMMTVKRIFLLDSQGVESAINEIDRNSTDLIEIMPGIMPKMVDRFSRLGVPVIAGGLIETKAEITAALSSGAVAVSTGKEELWYV